MCVNHGVTTCWYSLVYSLVAYKSIASTSHNEAVPAIHSNLLCNLNMLLKCCLFQESCSTTWFVCGLAFSSPVCLQRVQLPKRVARQYPSYGLYLYGEGAYAQETRGLKLTGAPVLFLPGNAGSYKQGEMELVFLYYFSQHILHMYTYAM